jgi:hypothetical protein
MYIYNIYIYIILKRCSTLSVIRDMQLKTTITWYCTPVTPATQEQRSRGSWVKASPGKK